MANRNSKILIYFLGCIALLFLCGSKTETEDKKSPFFIPELGGNADKPFIDLYGDGGNGSAIDTAIDNGKKAHEAGDEPNEDNNNNENDIVIDPSDDDQEKQPQEESNENKEVSIEVYYMTVRIDGIEFVDYEDEIVKKCNECEQIKLTDFYAETKTYIHILNLIKETGKEYIEDEKND